MRRSKTGKEKVFFCLNLGAFARSLAHLNFRPLLSLPQNHQQARAVSTSSNALQVLASKQQENAGYDLVLKEHAPPRASARRFLAALLSCCLQAALVLKTFGQPL